MSFGGRIKERREQLNITRRRLADLMGITASAVANYENGISSPKAELLYPLMEALQCDANYLYQDETRALGGYPVSLEYEEHEHIKKYRSLDPYGKEAVDGVLEVEHRRCEEARQARAAEIKARRERTEMAEEITPEAHKIIDLPFDELKASAGAGYQLDEDRMTTWKVRLNDLTRKADFCLEVDGHSMEPMIYDGDIILVRQQPAVDVGEIGLFTVDDKGYVKKQGEDRLISINPEYEDVFPDEYDSVFCRGKVIGVLNPEWIMER